MNKLLAIFFLLCSYNVIAQNNPSGIPTQFSTGWFRQGWHQSDSGEIIAPRIPNFTPRFPGTTILYQQNGVDTSLHYWTGGRWVKINAAGTDTTSLSNRINLKLNITDTANKWWGVGKRWSDTLYRVNDSTVGYTINGDAHTFQILGRLPSGGGSGTVTSVGLSLPSAFNVTPSTITTSGTFAVSGAGTTAQYIRGNGTLATTDTGMIPNFHLKVRSLFTGSSPITFNQTTGIIGINNANTSGTKGAASFTGAFSDNGSGLIDLLDLGAAGSCTGCTLNIDAKGRVTGYSDGAGGATDNVNIGSGFRPVNAITQEMRTYFAGFGNRLDTVANVNGITWSSDTARVTGLPTYFYTDSLFNTIGVITASNGLLRDGDDIQLGGTSDPGEPLTRDTYIHANAFLMKITGANASNAVFSVTNSSGGYALEGISSSSSGAAVHVFNSAGGVALSSEVLAGKAAYLSAISGIPIYVVGQPLNANGNNVMAEYHRQTGGTASAGISQSVDYWSQLNNATNDTIARVSIVATNATAGSQSGAYDIWLKNNGGSLSRVTRITSAGQHVWDKYPGFTAQVDTTTYKPVAIDGSGNVVKMAGWPGSGGGGTPGGSNTQVQFNDGGAFGGDAGFVYNKTTNRISVDSIRTYAIHVNPDTLTNVIMTIGNEEFNSGQDSVGAFGSGQGVTTWEGWPRRDIVYVEGYNDPYLGPKYKPNAGTLSMHYESDYFGRLEWFLMSITHGGYTQRNFFSHINKYTGSADLTMAFSEGVKMYGFDSTSFPYFAVAEGNAVISGIDQTFKVENKNLHNGHVFGSFSIAPQSDGSVNLGTGVNTNTVAFGNSMAISTGNQYMFTGLITNSNQGFSQLSGSTTNGGGYPFLIDHAVGSTGADIWRLHNTNGSGGATAIILETDGTSGDNMLIYRSNTRANDINTGYSSSNNDFRITTGASVLLGGTNLMTIKPTQKIGIGGVTSPTARLHITAGTSTANTAALKIDAGTNLTTPEDGAIEYNGTHWYATIGSTRYQLDQQGGATLYTGDGTLAGSRTVSGASNTLSLGTGGSPLASFNITSSGRTAIISGITYDVDANNTDANYTVAGNTIIAEISDVLTTNRTLTMPTASVNGQSVTLLMRFSAGSNHYSLSSAITDNSTGSTFTQLNWGVTYDFMVDQGLTWRLIRKY
jgi:hypothetical protein